MKYRQMIVWFLALAICVCFAACAASEPDSAPNDVPETSTEPETGDTAEPEQQDSEPLDLASLDEAALQETLQPYLAAYALCVDESFGAEYADGAYWRCYETEAESQSSGELDASAIKALIPTGDPVPEGLYVDAAYANCLPVSNFSSIAEMKAYFGEWIAEDAPFLTDGIARFFFAYDGALYRISGAQGSGARRIDPESARLTEQTDAGYLLQVDSYLFDEKESTPVTLTFAVRDGVLLITDDGT